MGVIPLPAELLAQVDLGERGVTVINCIHTEDPTRLQGTVPHPWSQRWL